MKLYLITNGNKSRPSRDYYVDAVVAAPSPTAARRIHPSGTDVRAEDFSRHGSWCKQEQVEVRYLGRAAPAMKAGLITSNFYGV